MTNVEIPGISRKDRAWVAESVVRLYQQPGRFYHNLSHVETMRFAASQMQSQLDPLVVDMAILFHDAVYRPGLRDNEQRSAEFAKNTLFNLVSHAQITAISDLILATKNYEKPRTARSGQFVEQRPSNRSQFRFGNLGG